MTAQGYSESALVANRTSLLLYGGSDLDRRAWAEEAALNFEEEGPLRIVGDDAEFLKTLSITRGVVFIPDISALSIQSQGELVRILRAREERPKFVIGISGNPVAAREQNRIRWDLSFVLQVARVNLDTPALAEALRSRRAQTPKRAPTSAPTPAPGSTQKPKPVGSTQASRRVRPAKSARVARSAVQAGRKPAARKGR